LSNFSLTPAQLALLQSPLDAHIFLEGLAGAGKTTAGVARLLSLLEAGIPGESILLLVPQRTLAEPYYAALREPATPAGGAVSLLTAGGLAQRMVDLFWPVVAEAAGFTRPDDLPAFLTLETAQYYMAHLVQPLLDEETLFDSVTIERNRLYSQIIDNLNKAAVVGFPHSEIGERLKRAWVGEPRQLSVYDDVQTCADKFREFCLAKNLLDFSLQIEVFWKYLWPTPLFQEYLKRTYRHLVFDNLEEDMPIAHDLVRQWLPYLDSALLIYDWDAGYRRFLGADPDGGYELRAHCTVQFSFEDSLVVSPEITVLTDHLVNALGPPLQTGLKSQTERSSVGHTIPLEYTYHRFYPQMLDWVVEQIAHLVLEDGVAPGEIVVLAPFLSDALRFSLAQRLQSFQVPVRSHRPSRSLREEPAAQCLLTLAALAHPQWGIYPTNYDVTYALMQSVEGLDLVRAQLLTEIIYRRGKAGVYPVLATFDQIRPEVQERITFRLGNRYERLRMWLEAAGKAPDEIDHFLSRLFGEVLSQAGFGFSNSYDAGEVTANLIESIRKFRWVAGGTLAEEGFPLGKEYLEMVQQGVIAAQYISGWKAQPEDAVLLAPAYTFLMSNRPVEVQFWLDVGSRGWAERLYQPLTHPYVLSRAWEMGRLWTDADEVQVARDSLCRLALGLLRRCRSKVYLGLSELGEQGYEQRGPLLLALQRVLRNLVGDTG
jgi:hypothetical protein